MPPAYSHVTRVTLQHKVAVNLISPPFPRPGLPPPNAPHPPVWTKLFNFLKASFLRYIFFFYKNMYDARIVQIVHKKTLLNVSVTTEKERVNRIWNGVFLSNWVAVKYFVGSPEKNTYNRTHIIPQNTLKTKVLWKEWVDRSDRFPEETAKGDKSEQWANVFL